MSRSYRCSGPLLVNQEILLACIFHWSFHVLVPLLGHSCEPEDPIADVGTFFYLQFWTCGELFVLIRYSPHLSVTLIGRLTFVSESWATLVNQEIAGTVSFGRRSSLFTACVPNQASSTSCSDFEARLLNARHLSSGLRPVSCLFFLFPTNPPTARAPKKRIGGSGSLALQWDMCC